MSFDSFNFHPSISHNLKAIKFVKPTPIQSAAIPAVLAGGDLIGLAQTGTGKTAAFILPILERLITAKRKQVRALVVVPTRELAEQIKDVAVELSRGMQIRVVTIYGGVSIRPQIEKLKQGCEIVIACPGRLLDHLSQRTIDLRNVEVLVLDEADQMFDMGFLPDIRRILSHLPKKRQSLLFSATMPPEIKKLTHDVLSNPETVQVGDIRPIETVAHALYPVPSALKASLLVQLLKTIDSESVLIFTRTKHRARRLEKTLQQNDFRVASLHGDLSQNRRQSSMKGFRDGKFQIMVATDIAARGIDISSVSHVINFDIPNTTDAYTHRIGRTGRAQRTGDAFTFVSPEDEAQVRAIEKVLKAKIERKTLEGFNYRAISASTAEATREDRTANRGGRRPQRSHSRRR